MIDPKKTYNINEAARALEWDEETARRRLHAINERSGGKLLRLVSRPGKRPRYIMQGAMLRQLVGLPDEDLVERFDMLEETVREMKREHESRVMKAVAAQPLARSA